MRRLIRYGKRVVVRAEVKAATGVVADEARRFRRSHEAWLAAMASRERVAERADRRIAKATGGLTVFQWNSRCHSRRINTDIDSPAVARAVRAKADVRQAVADADHLRSEADAIVRTARADLASAARALLRYTSRAQVVFLTTSLLTGDGLEMIRQWNDQQSDAAAAGGVTLQAVDVRELDSLSATEYRRPEIVWTA